MQPAITTVTAWPCLRISLPVLVNTAARHTKSRSALLTVEHLPTYACYNKESAGQVEIIQNTILEVVQVF